ncbi:YihY/virulence factor BrkB family protein, partial [Nocardiopsis mangrovi]
MRERTRRAAEAWRRRHPRLGTPALIVVRTVRSVVRSRVVGLSAEAAFFSLLSLPALLLGVAGTLGHLAPVLGAGTVLDIRGWLLDLAAKALTPDAVDSVVAPMVDEFLGGAQGGVLSVTFLVSLWSGSRAMSVFIEAITIAYGLDDLRGYVRQRVLAFLGYIGALLFALIVLPVMVAGPEAVRELLPMTAGHLGTAYWPAVAFLSTGAVTLLYLLATPVRPPLWRYLPGSLLATAILLLGSVLLRAYLGASFGQVTIYGSLAAPIAILTWLWLMALAVLIGSALNAEIDAAWPTARTAAARARIAARRHERAALMVERREEALRTVAEPGEEPDPGPDPEPEAAGGAAKAADPAGGEAGGGSGAPDRDGGAPADRVPSRPEPGGPGTAVAPRRASRRPSGLRKTSN